MKKSQSAHAFILSPDGTHILLVMRRDTPVWVIPGGGLEEGETPIDCALREGAEETGLTLKLLEKIGISHPRNHLSNISHLYKLMPTGGMETLTQETQDIRWFPLCKLPLMPPPYPEWIHDMQTLALPFEKVVRSVNYWAFAKNVFLHPILILRFLLSRAGLHMNSKVER